MTNDAKSADGETNLPDNFVSLMVQDVKSTVKDVSLSIRETKSTAKDAKSADEETNLSDNFVWLMVEDAKPVVQETKSVVNFASLPFYA